MLCVLALADLDLAAPADAAAAADRVDVDPEPPGGVEHGRAGLRTGLAGPDGVKTTRWSSGSGPLKPAEPAAHRAQPLRTPSRLAAAAAAGLRRLAGVAVAGDPRRAVLVVARS